MVWHRRRPLSETSHRSPLFPPVPLSLCIETTPRKTGIIILNTTRKWKKRKKRRENGNNCGSARIYGVKMESRPSRRRSRVPWQMARRYSHTAINIHNKILAIFTISDLFSIATPTIILALLDDMRFGRFHRRLVSDLFDVGGSEKKKFETSMKW